MRQALAQRHGLDGAEVTVGAGSTGILYHLSRGYLAPGDQVVMHTPSFEAYPIIVTLAQADAVAVPMAGGHTDVEALAAAVTPHTSSCSSPTRTTRPARRSTPSACAGSPSGWPVGASS